MSRLLADSLQSKLRVGVVASMAPHKRHGSVVFNVSGFGYTRRDFIVDDPDILHRQTKELAPVVIDQIILIDNTLPKKPANCKPVLIDITVNGCRRIYDGLTFDKLLEQTV